MKKDPHNLDSEVMDHILKGDSFPKDMPSEFIEHDIKAFFDTLFDQTDIKRSDIIRIANLPRTYGYQIFNGSRIADKDYYLRIAIAMGLTLSMTKRLLAVTGSGTLHPLIKRDAAVIFAINHGYDLMTTYDFMTELELEPLEKDCENDEES